MEYLYLLVAIPFIVSSVVLYRKYKIMSTKYELVIRELNKVLREGYYEGDIPLETTDKDGVVLTKHTYHYVVYVNEIDRYINGECNVTLNRVEITNGYESSRYQHIKDTVIERFCSVIPSNKVTWLESESVIKEQRREKLKQINKIV